MPERSERNDLKHEITKQTVTNNMHDLLYNYLCCTEIENVVFTYSWHGERKEIYDNLICRLRNEGIQFVEKIIVLKCSEEENIKRAEMDGRDCARIQRGMRNTFSFYDLYDYPTIDSTKLTCKEVANQIIEMISQGE